MIAPVFKIFDTKAPLKFEWSQAPDGKIYDIQYFPFIDSDGSAMVLKIGFDITDRKNTEDALLKSEGCRGFKSLHSVISALPLTTSSAKVSQSGAPQAVQL